LKKFNFWPLFVLALLMMGIFLATWTILTVSKNQVVESDDYMGRYQYVDANINKIMKDKLEFEKKYKIEFVDKVFKPGKHQIKLKIIDLSTGMNFKDADLLVQFARYETHDSDVVIDIFSVQDDMYVSSEFETIKDGRWIINIMVDINGLIGHKIYYVYLDGTLSSKRDNQRELLKN